MIRRIVLVLLLLVPMLSWGDGLPGHYPRRVMHEGSVDSVDFSALSVVIGDATFYISSTTQIMAPNRRQASHADLQVGRNVGCNYQVEGGSRRVLTQVWLLPPGASFED